MGFDKCVGTQAGGREYETNEISETSENLDNFSFVSLISFVSYSLSILIYCRILKGVVQIVHDDAQKQ